MAAKGPTAELKEHDKRAKAVNKAAFDRDRVVGTVKCLSCQKPRLVFSSVGKRDSMYTGIRDEFETSKPEIEESFMCGTPLFLEATHALAAKVQVLSGVTCHTPVQKYYYTTKSMTFPPVCCHCGSFDVEVRNGELPMCESCDADMDLEPVKSGKINKYEATKLVKEKKAQRRKAHKKAKASATIAKKRRRRTRMRKRRRKTNLSLTTTKTRIKWRMKMTSGRTTPRTNGTSLASVMTTSLGPWGSSVLHPRATTSRVQQSRPLMI